MTITPDELSVMIAEFLTTIRGSTSGGHIAVTSDSDLLDDIGMDSLEMTQLVYWLEERKSVRLDLDRLDLEDLRSIQKLALHINGVSV